MEMFLFDDQNADCRVFLRHIFSLKENPVLCSFLTRVGIVLREEVFRQPQRPYHEAIPVFESVEELADRHYASIYHHVAQERPGRRITNDSSTTGVFGFGKQNSDLKQRFQNPRLEGMEGYLHDMPMAI